MRLALVNFLQFVMQFVLRVLGSSQDRTTDFPTDRSIPVKGINDLDLTAVMMKLMEPAPEGKGWTLDEAEMSEKWYKRFLTLCQLYPKFPVVPNYYIDTFWHQHILDTRAYAKDCKEVLGYFLHHYPYFGLRGDAQERDDSFNETNKLYIKHFGEDCTSMVAGIGDHGSQECRPDKIKAQGCSAPCQGGTACNGGGTCAPCTVDVGVRVDKERYAVSMNCGGGGSGTGCRQGCSRGR